MRSLVLAACLLLAVVTWPLKSQAGANSNKDSSDLVTLTGCLQSRLGTYTLIEQDGTTHQLIGAANKLGHQVNRQIEVSGKPTIRSVDTTVPGGSSGAVEKQAFEVKTVKRIADTCQSE